MSPLALYLPIGTVCPTRNGRSGPGTRAVAGLLLALAAASIPAGAAAQPPAPLTLEQAMAMAKRDFMGAPVTAAWWSVDARSVYYRYQPPGAKEAATFEVNPRTGSVREVPAEDLGLVDADARGYDGNRTHAVYERAGDIWFRDIDQSTPIQVTRDAAGAADPLFSVQAPGSEEARVFFRRGNDWFAWVANGGVETPLLALRAGPPSTTAPAAAPGQGVTVDLGPEVVIARSSLAPSGRHALAVTTPKGYDVGRVAQMPIYLTASGYPEMLDLGPRIGRNSPAPESLWLVDVPAGQARPVDLAGLPGLLDDPFADLRAALERPALAGPRGIEIQATAWSDDGRQLAVVIATLDRKDWWLAAIDPATGRTDVRHHDRGALVIASQQLGFLPDHRLWFLSEQGGWFGLYLDDGQSTRPVATGPFEVANVQWSADGRRAFFQCNRKEPGDHEVCRVNADGSDLRELTALDGVGTYLDLDAFRLSPDGRRLAVRYSGPYLPMQLALVDAETGETRRIGDTRGAALKAHAAPLVEPQIVQVPSTHFPGTIWSKLFRPKVLKPGHRYPIVLLLHGGNVVQFVGRNQSGPFSEALLANFLVQHGYLVMQIDYRGSAGYGKDFRNAIYPRMGLLEVEDMRDAVAWLVKHQQGDAGHAGTYGCSYGGYLAYLSAFLAGDLFKAVAAANGWTDLTATVNDNPNAILGTPDLNPEAYRDSSPVSHAGGLRSELLILHNVDDSAVPFEHALRVVQRLLDLGKQGWNMVSYPTGDHCFGARPDLQVDAYRRSFQLFERALKP